MQFWYNITWKESAYHIVMSSIKCVTLEEEMAKNPELKMSDIQLLKEWSEKQPHLPQIQDVQFAIYLHSNYYQLEPTKSTIENYYTMRTQVPEFFSNRDPLKVKEVQESFTVVASLVMKEKTKQGYNIILSRLIDLEPSRYILNDVIKCGFMISDSHLWKHGSSPGYIWIIDSTGLSFGHMMRFNPISLKKLINYVQDALPIRLLAIHCVNISPIVHLIFNMSRPFLKPEMLQLIHFHTSIKSADEHFPIDALPNEMGGKAGATRELLNLQIKKIEDFREWFLEDEAINRMDESLRISQRKNFLSYFWR